MHVLHFAYLDAGTGSLIIQSIIGVVAGVTVFGRNAISRFSSKMKQVFNSRGGQKSEAETE
jgi:hypothetical protein